MSNAIWIISRRLALFWRSGFDFNPPYLINKPDMKTALADSSIFLEDVWMKWTDEVLYLWEEQYQEVEMPERQTLMTFFWRFHIFKCPANHKSFLNGDLILCLDVLRRPPTSSATRTSRWSGWEGGCGCSGWMIGLVASFPELIAMYSWMSYWI